MKPVLPPALAVLLAAVWLAAAPAHAGGRDDHERARQAVLAGEVMPLPQVLERLAREQPGQVLEVELEREDKRWVYEIRLLRNDGQLTRLKLDARTAAVLPGPARAGGHDRGRAPGQESPR